jgi:hypothetical protein
MEHAPVGMSKKQERAQKIREAEKQNPRLF